MKISRLRRNSYIKDSHTNHPPLAPSSAHYCKINHVLREIHYYQSLKNGRKTCYKFQSYEKVSLVGNPNMQKCNQRAKGFKESHSSKIDKLTLESKKWVFHLYKVGSKRRREQMDAFLGTHNIP